MTTPNHPPESNEAGNTNGVRIWFRRTVVCIVLITGLVIALPIFLSLTDQQSQAIATVESLGGHVRTEPNPIAPAWLRRAVGFQLPTRNVAQSVSFDESRVQDVDLVVLQKLTTIDAISLNGTSVSDAGIAHFKDLPKLRRISLRDSQITDLGLSALAELKQIQYLELDGTQVTDGGLQAIKTLPHLHVLSLSRTSITDDGLSTLAEMKTLIALALADTKVTNRGLKSLTVLPVLRMLDLRGTAVTDEGVASFSTTARTEITR